MKLSLEEQPLTEDTTYDFDELSILIHQQDHVYFEDSKLDYIKNVLGQGTFKLLKV